MAPNFEPSSKYVQANLNLMNEEDNPFKNQNLYYMCILSSGAGRWKTLRVPVVIGGDNMPSPVAIGLTDLPNIGEASSSITDMYVFQGRRNWFSSGQTYS